MRTNTLGYLQTKLNLKPVLLAFVSTILLSACGVKGDLYQTPEPVENTAETHQEISVLANESSPKDKTLNASGALSTKAIQPSNNIEAEQP